MNMTSSAGACPKSSSDTTAVRVRQFEAGAVVPSSSIVDGVRTSNRID
jgi:hypothetical protein